MELKDRITLEELGEKKMQKKLSSVSEHGMSAITHYLDNHKNGISTYYKQKAVEHMQEALAYKLPDEDFTEELAEKALQYLIKDFFNDVPFLPTWKENYFVYHSRSLVFRFHLSARTAQRGYAMQCLARKVA